MKKLFILVFCSVFLWSCTNANDSEAVNPSEEILTTNEQSTETAKDNTIETEAVYRKISAEEAYDMMAAIETFILLDVRSEAEYAEKRIDGAILIPDSEIAERAEIDLPDKTAIIFVYCRSGRRSMSAAEKLVDMGYMNVYDFGGILDWSYETVSD